MSSLTTAPDKDHRCSDRCGVSTERTAGTGIACGEICCRCDLLVRPGHWNESGVLVPASFKGRYGRRAALPVSLTALPRTAKWNPCPVPWRSGRVAEGAGLLNQYTGNRIVGSNPTSSATSDLARKRDLFRLRFNRFSCGTAGTLMP